MNDNIIFEVVIERDANENALADVLHIRTLHDMERYLNTYARDLHGDAWWQRYDGTTSIAAAGDRKTINDAAYGYEEAYDGVDNGHDDYTEVRHLVVVEFDSDGRMIDYAIGSRRFMYDSGSKRVYWC